MIPCWVWPLSTSGTKDGIAKIPIYQWWNHRCLSNRCTRTKRHYYLILMTIHLHLQFQLGLNLKLYPHNLNRKKFHMNSTRKWSHGQTSGKSSVGALKVWIRLLFFIVPIDVCLFIFCVKWNTHDIFSAMIWYIELTRSSENNRLDVIRRKPSERVIYKAWCKDVVVAYGSITAYMCAERLRWTPLPSSCAESGPIFDVVNQTSFESPDDFRILRNDWPYGSLESNITHLIIWSKSRILTDPETELITPRSRQLIDAFVDATFVSRLKQDDAEIDADEMVMWFKNWGALQSVHGLEHIHVLVRNAPEDVLEEWIREYRWQAWLPFRVSHFSYSLWDT